jgi:hypothetical protein
MTNVRELLDTAAGEPAAATPDVVTADLRRGRLALRRRRGVRGASVLLAASAAVALGLAVVPNLGGDDTTRQTIIAPAGTSANPGVDLVPWDAGAAPKPISPSLVPEGWTVSGNEYALVLSPPGVTTSPDDFRGKLVAMLAGDSTAASGARPVTVGGEHGTVSREGDTTILLWPLADGRGMDIQAPQSLNWDTATLVRFAEGLTVTADARASRG